MIIGSDLDELEEEPTNPSSVISDFDFRALAEKEEEEGLLFNVEPPVFDLRQSSMPEAVGVDKKKKKCKKKKKKKIWNKEFFSGGLLKLKGLPSSIWPKRISKVASRTLP